MKVELNPRTNTFSGNLLAKEMVDSYSQSKVFSYTFATPNNTTSSSATATQYKGIFSILNTDDIVQQMPLKEWGFTNYGQAREISVRAFYCIRSGDHFNNESEAKDSLKGTFEWLTGRFYNDDAGTNRTLNAFSKVAENRETLYKQTQQDNTSILVKENVNDYKNKMGMRLSRHLKESWIINKKIYQTPAFFLQDLANLAGKEKGYPFAGRLVAPKYAFAKMSFFATSGELPGKLIGGMAHPHLPQTYYLIAKNNFVALV